MLIDQFLFPVKTHINQQLANENQQLAGDNQQLSNQNQQLNSNLADARDVIAGLEDQNEQ